MGGLRGPERIKRTSAIFEMRGIPKQIKRLLQHFGGLNNVPITSLQLNQAMQMKEVAQKLKVEIDRLPYGSELKVRVKEKIATLARTGLMLHVAENRRISNRDIEDCLRDAFICMFGSVAFVLTVERTFAAPLPIIEVPEPEAAPIEPPSVVDVKKEEAPKTPAAESAPVVRGVMTLKSISPEKLNGLRTALKTKEDRFSAFKEIEELGPAAADLIPDIVELIRARMQPHWYDFFTAKESILESAVEALRAIGTAAHGTYPLLADLLVSGRHSWGTVYDICWTLGNFDKKASGPIIFAFFKDAKRSSSSRWSAAYFLTEAFEDNNGIAPALIDFLADPKSDVTGRRLLIEHLLKRVNDWKNTDSVLKKYYPDRYKASLTKIVPILRDMKNDRDEWLRKAVEEALKVCEPILTA